MAIGKGRGIGKERLTQKQRKDLLKGDVSTWSETQIKQELKREIRNLRSKISKMKKSELWQIPEVRNFQENILESLKGKDINNMSATSARSMYYNVVNKATMAGKEAGYDYMRQRAEGLTGYLSQATVEGFESHYDKSGNLTVIQNGKTYQLSSKQVSDFWSLFREVYEKSAIAQLKDYDKGQQGVSTVFEIFQSGEKNIDALAKKYWKERKELGEPVPKWKDLETSDKLGYVIDAMVTSKTNSLQELQREATSQVSGRIKMLR